MKDSVVLKRSMFSAKLPKSVRNSGIMAGFEDDDMLEAPPEEDTMPQMARTPQNPEILMNTLRGDMRSVDARYQELAQMVGEEAAQETPPEVLAMLQMQFGQQQGGIGALPQGAGMMPPPMESGAPMGAPGGAPAMPSPQDMAAMQGGMPPQGAMPPGMESAVPLPQGGAEQAPQGFAKGGAAKPRGDDLQLLEGGIGGGGGGFGSAMRPPPFEVTPAGQQALAQGSASRQSLRDYLAQKSKEVGQFFSGANQYLGSKFMSPQPTVSRMTGGSPPMNLSVQSQNVLTQNPATGTLVQGTGTKFAPFTTMGPLQSPTLTQGLTQGLNRLVVEYPRVAALLPPSLLIAVGVAGPNLTEEQRSTPLTPEEQAKYNETMAQIDAVNRPTVFSPDRPTPQQLEKLVGTPPEAPPAPIPAPATEAEEKTTEDFIKDTLAKPKALSRIERIKQARGEYEPLYKELLGDTKEDAKTNALLLLADAGFKLASTYKPTFAMAVAEAGKDVPRGIANIIAQTKDRDIKVKTAALSQAISDITAEDAARRAKEEKILDIDKAILVEQVKQGKNNKEIAKKGELGLINIETKDGSFVRTEIDPNNSFVKSVLGSEYRLNEKANPYVVNRGAAPTVVVEDGKQRLQIADNMGRIEDALGVVAEIENDIKNAYSPGTWFSDKVNNIFVPLVPDAIKAPNLNVAATSASLKSNFNRLIKMVASSERGGGRLSNYAEQVERVATDGFNNPTGLMEDAEIAAKSVASLRTNLLNEWNRDATRTGIIRYDRIMTVPNIGTKNDPFVLSSDPEQQQIMLNYLGNTFGRVKDPNAVVYLNRGAAGVKAYRPSELRALAGD